MPQKRIPLEATNIYHVWTHANGSENLFRVEENYRFFLERYSKYVHPVVDTFAYCLMPNHLHLMIRVKEREEVLKHARKQKKRPSLTSFKNDSSFSAFISQQFSNLFNSYTQSYNKKYDRKGSLFIPNFRRRLVDTKEYFTSLIAYIHNNPVHHGFVEDLNNWSHSSWHAYLNNQKTKINKAVGLKWFGDVQAFKETHRRVQMKALISVFEE